MRIAVVGGGPGGLYFARLIRGLTDGCEVDVYERNAHDATFGFGIGFSAKTLANLRSADERTHDEIIAASISWDGMALDHRGEGLTWPGFGMDGVSRIELLGLLQTAARDAGATLHFEREVGLEDIADADVVVVADGANSAIRGERFGTELVPGRTRYMWLGSTGPFARASFCVRTNDAGTFALHGYPYAEGRNTLVIETDEEAWRRAGLHRFAEACTAPGESDEGSARYLEELFAEDLQGHPILLNNSKWLTFVTVRNERWSEGNLVLLGDAAHTAHPSVASGTKMAMEDAIALAEELAAHGDASSSKVDLPAAFWAYEARRKPDTEHIQERAARSQEWWATLERRVDLDAAQLAFSYMTRAGAADYRLLRKLAPTLTDAALRSAGAEPAVTPLQMPLALPDRRLSGRLVGPAGRSLAAELSADAVAGDVEHALAAARALRDAGADVIALPGRVTDQGHQGALRVTERIRLELGLVTLAAWDRGDLDQAAAEVLAGRIDLVETDQEEAWASSVPTSSSTSSASPRM